MVSHFTDTQMQYRSHTFSHGWLRGLVILAQLCTRLGDSMMAKSYRFGISAINLGIYGCQPLVVTLAESLEGNGKEAW